MNRLTFIQLRAEDETNCKLFEQLVRPYAAELDAHQERKTPEEVIARWTKSMIDMQGAADRHLELCFDGDKLIGFLYGKVDHPEHRGFIKPGFGYIMEFYVLPELRRSGYGTEMYSRLQALFRRDGAERLYLTADPVTGKPFWESLGFCSTGEKSPENHLDIYEKAI